MSRHTVHDPAGFTDPAGARILCDHCPRPAVWRRKRNSRPTRHLCAWCHDLLRTHPEETR